MRFLGRGLSKGVRVGEPGRGNARSTQRAVQRALNVCRYVDLTAPYTRPAVTAETRHTWQRACGCKEVRVAAQRHLAERCSFGPSEPHGGGRRAQTRGTGHAPARACSCRSTALAATQPCAAAEGASGLQGQPRARVPQATRVGLGAGAACRLAPPAVGRPAVAVAPCAAGRPSSLQEPVRPRRDHGRRCNGTLSVSRGYGCVTRHGIQACLRAAKRTAQSAAAQGAQAAARWRSSFSMRRSFARVFACDLTPMTPPPHCLRTSS